MPNDKTQTNEPYEVSVDLNPSNYSAETIETIKDLLKKEDATQKESWDRRHPRYDTTSEVLNEATARAEQKCQIDLSHSSNGKGSITMVKTIKDSTEIYTFKTPKIALKLSGILDEYGLKHEFKDNGYKGPRR